MPFWAKICKVSLYAAPTVCTLLRLVPISPSEVPANRRRIAGQLEVGGQFLTGFDARCDSTSRDGRRVTKTERCPSHRRQGIVHDCGDGLGRVAQTLEFRPSLVDGGEALEAFEQRGTEDRASGKPARLKTCRERPPCCPGILSRSAPMRRTLRQFLA